MVNNKRRDLLKLSALAAAGFLLPSATVKAANWLDSFDDKNAKTKKFGLQLYGIRDALAKDPKTVLKKIADMGYKYIEPSDGKLGLFSGMSNKDYKSFVNDLGMKIHSVHTNVYQGFEKKVEESTAIGIDYLIYNWEGPGKTLDDYKRMADDFNKKGRYCKENGIKFAFHNHDFTFYNLDGIIPQEWLLDHTDLELVDYQIDFYWTIYAGQDPIEWVNKYPNRFKLCHFKDRSKTEKDREGKGIVELGTGSIDFQNILNKTRNTFMKYYIVDQDTCNERENPLECAKVDADYMKQLRF